MDALDEKRGRKEKEAQKEKKEWREKKEASLDAMDIVE